MNEGPTPTAEQGGTRAYALREGIAHRVLGRRGRQRHGRCLPEHCALCTNDAALAACSLCRHRLAGRRQLRRASNP
ncbi:MAG: hypothetical protein J5I81_02215, partial [Nitrococcus mobilis]|nr:hypothetical protein [Nitrococcus mobilis]